MFCAIHNAQRKIIARNCKSVTYLIVSQTCGKPSRAFRACFLLLCMFVWRRNKLKLLSLGRYGFYIWILYDILTPNFFFLLSYFLVEELVELEQAYFI